MDSDASEIVAQIKKVDLKETNKIIGGGCLKHLLDLGEELVGELPARNGLPMVDRKIFLDFLVSRVCLVQPELSWLVDTLTRLETIGAKNSPKIY